MNLQIGKFLKFQPQLPFRFKVDLYNSNDEYMEVLTYAVKSITMPTYQFITDSKKNYGNFTYTIPIRKTDSLDLKIEFEETDNMDVMNYISDLTTYRGQTYSTNNVKIVVHEYFEKTEIVWTMRGVLMEYEHSSFNRSGQTSPTSCSMTFKATSIERKFV